MAQRKASPFKLALFIILGLALGGVALFSFSKRRWLSTNCAFVLCFEDSINGLELAAPVKLKGVPVGYVGKISLQVNALNNTLHTLIVIHIASDAFVIDQPDFSSSKNIQNLVLQEIENGLCAKLKHQSYLTGRLFIELDYEKKEKRKRTPGKLIGLYQIPTLPSQLSKIGDSLTALLSKLNVEEVGSFVKSLNKIAHRIEWELDTGNSDAFVQTSKQTLSALKAFFDSPKWFNSLDAFCHASDKVTQLGKDGQATLQRLSNDFNRASKETLKAMQSAEKFFTDMHEMTAPEGRMRYFFEESVREIGQLMRSLRQLTEILERYPNALIFGKPTT